MKNLLAIIFALVITVSATNAATNSFKQAGTNFKNAVKQDYQNAKEAIKKDADNANKEAKAARDAKNKERKAALKDKRDAQIKAIDKQISDKKRLIKDTKQANLTETQKTVRIRNYERQIESLERSKDRVDSIYKSSVEAIK